MIHLLIFALVVLLVVAVCVYAIREFLPADARLKQIACFVVVLIGVLLVLSRLLGYA